ncbi:MAG: V-type ATP synthase subunit E [Methanoregulaceae archaeon PtaB.Bin056]|nr:MAG: V-type ATP synthase subunit E [Methanoregulaceae archaeon PtaB.Bin056]
MAIDDLIKAVEVSGQERIQEIQERSKAEADEIIREAHEKDLPIKKRFMDGAMQSVAIQRNKILSEAREKSRMEIIQSKNEVFERVFEEAVQKLESIRKDPDYRKIQKHLLEESIGELGSESIILHVDRKDEDLVKDLLKEMNISAEIVSDLTCAGGLNAYSQDERFVIFNTLESRLKKAKEIYRPEIFSVLFGE